MELKDLPIELQDAIAQATHHDKQYLNKHHKYNGNDNSKSQLGDLSMLKTERKPVQDLHEDYIMD